MMNTLKNRFRRMMVFLLTDLGSLGTPSVIVRHVGFDFFT